MLTVNADVFTVPAVVVTRAEEGAVPQVCFPPAARHVVHQDGTRAAAVEGAAPHSGAGTATNDVNVNSY